MSKMKVAVLVVEDDVIQRLLAVDVVEAAGCEAIEAINGDDALKMLEARGDIAILFTDVSMPGSTDGIELARYVKAHFPDVQIIVVSGHASPAEDPLPAGSAFFAKPYHVGQVTQTLRRFATVH